MRRPSLLACLLAACSLSALDTSTIPANHTWMVQVDVRALADGPLGAELRTRFAKSPLAARLEVLHAITGSDPWTDLDRVVISGPGRGPDGVVVAVRGRFDAAKLGTLAASAPGHATEDLGERTLHTWQAPHGHQDYGIMATSDLLLLSHTRSALEAALATVDGLATPAVFEDPAPGGSPALLTAIGMGIAPRGGGPQAALLAQVAGGSLRVLIENGDLVVDAHLAAKDAQAAGRFMDIANGLRAMMAFDAEEDPRKQELARLVSALDFSRDNDRISISLRTPLAEALDLARSLHALKQEHHCHRGPEAPQ